MPDVILGRGKLSMAAGGHMRGAVWNMSSGGSAAHVSRTFWTVVRILPFTLRWEVIGRFQAEFDHKSDLIRPMF